MTIPKICAVVTGTTINIFLDNLDKIQNISELIELRLDYLQNLNTETLEKIRKRISSVCIATIRKQTEGGKFIKPEDERFELIYKTCELGFDYIDIELSSMQYFDLKRLKKTKLIVSYHNFENTPRMESLKMILKMMHKYSPDIIKIATITQSDADNKLLYSLLINKNKSERMIVIGMGIIGKLTRVIAPLLGSEWTYASYGSENAAPGQYDIREYQTIYRYIT